jgi:DNA-binding CsgD family transcriptional regulator
LNDYAPLNPRLSFHAAVKPGEVLWDYKVFSEETMNRSPFYAGFLAPIGFRYFLSAVLDAENGQFALISTQRARKQGHVDGPEIKLMQRLVPHVRQAFDVTRRLREAGEARQSLEGAFECLADGVALIGTDGTVIYTNDSFQAIARRNDGIAIRKGMIEIAAAESRDRLAAAMAAVLDLRNSDIETATISDFPVPRAAGAPPYLLSVRPLIDQTGEHRAEPSAIFFVRDPLSRNAAAIGVLREVFGLTEAEASLAQALQAGIALGAYAREHAVSLNTIYTHLRRIREKTGCNRMAELIRKLNDLQVPLRIE